MAYIQLRDANWRIPYVGGWCEGYTEGSFGFATLPTLQNQTTSGKYTSATAAWNAGQGNHPGELPPAGVTVPVFFALGSTDQGHVAISLDDGSVASSTQAGFHTQGYIHPNLQSLIDLYAQYNNGCTYLGWSEFVGGVRVVEQITEGGTVDTIKSMYSRLLGREADQGGIDTYTKAAQDKGWEFVYNDLKNSDEGQKDWAWRNPDAVHALEAKVSDLSTSSSTASQTLVDIRSQLADIQGQLSSVSADKTSLEATVTSQNDMITALKKQIADQSVIPAAPIDYSWVEKLQQWLRGIFK